MKRFSMSLVSLWLSFGLLGSVVCEIIGVDSVSVFAGARMPLMAAMFALAGVTVAFRATWMTRLREAYESEDHMENVDELCERGQTTTTHAGFDRLSAALSHVTTLLCLTALLQVTLGFWSIPIASGFCFGAAFAGTTTFIYMSVRLRRIDHAWIKKIELDVQQKRRKTAPVA